MKIVLKTILFTVYLSFLLTESKLYSQNPVIDSLQKILAISKEDTVKVNILNSLADQYKRIDPDKVDQYAEQANTVAQKIGYKKGIAAALINKGIFYRLKGDYPKSIETFNKSLKLCREAHLKEQEALSLMGIGVANDYLGEFDDALQYYGKSLRIFQEINDKKGQSKVFMGMAVVYDFQGNYTKSLEFHLKSLHMQEDLNDKMGMGGTLMNIGGVYRNLGKDSSALPYYMRSLKIREELGDKNGIAQTYNSLGSLFRAFKDYEKALSYYEQSLNIRKEIGDKNGAATVTGNIGALYSDEGKYEKSIAYYQECLKIKETLGDKNGMSVAFTNIGNSLLKLSKYDEAISYFLKAKDIALKSGIRSLEKENYMNLSQAYEVKGDYKEALKYHQLLGNIKDTLYNETSSKQIAEMQTKYDTEKNRKEIELLNKDKELKDTVIKKQDLWRNFLTGIVGLIIILVLVLLFAFRNKQKANTQLMILNNEITHQKHKIEEQKEIVEEKQKEIIDSINYAKRLQDAILPPQKLIREHLQDSFILYKPKDIVAGDFYWMEVIQLKDSSEELIFLAAADCTGHGVPGALVSVVCSNALNRAVKEFHMTETGMILDKVTELVLETFEKSSSDVRDGMDISLICFNKTQKKIYWSGANNPLWYVKNGEMFEVIADKQPIGKFEKMKPFSTKNIVYEQNVTFYLFTDGYADQFGGPKGKKFKYSQFKEVLLAGNQKPMEEQRSILDSAFEEWRGNLEQIDDVCIIGVRLY